MNLSPIFRKTILLLLLVILVIIAVPLSFLGLTYFRDGAIIPSQKKGYVNDASHLDETKISSLVAVSDIPGVAISQIEAIVVKASQLQQKISIGGARHSMGGQTVYPDGINVDMTRLKYLKLDSVNNILTVGAGALWADVIAYLDKFGKSVAIMQSNNSFSVGGSISVNCHGWTTGSPPVASTIESFRLITSKGEVLTCSRILHPELFSLVLGGYGLFGVIVDVRLKVVNNQMYSVKQELFSSSQYVKKFKDLVNKKDGVRMAYGRINITKVNFMNEAMITTYSVMDSAKLLPLSQNTLMAFRRVVFRSSANSDYGKALRWNAEKMGRFLLQGKQFSRNQILNEGVEIFENSDPKYTDILHEYFVPVDFAEQFIDSMKVIFPQYKVDLLNITVRDVKKDTDAYMNYAREDVFGFVLLFNQKRDGTEEYEMTALTRRLINASLRCHGSYYLPYRLHATREQFYSTYPQAKSFFAMKKKMDSGEVFSNKFYQLYK